jgi:hypothetical protein
MVVVGREDVHLEEGGRRFVMHHMAEQRRQQHTHPLKPYICDENIDTEGRKRRQIRSDLYVPAVEETSSKGIHEMKRKQCRNADMKICSQNAVSEGTARGTARGNNALSLRCILSWRV